MEHVCFKPFKPFIPFKLLINPNRSFYSLKQALPAQVKYRPACIALHVDFGGTYISFFVSGVRFADDDIGCKAGQLLFA